MSLSLIWFINGRRLLWLIVAAALACFVFNLIRFKPWQDTPLSLSIEQNSSKVSAPTQAVNVSLKSQPEDNYKSQKDIFFSSGVAATASLATNVKSAPAGQLPAQFKVVGSLVSDSSTIIIEDTAQSKMYFLNQNKQEGDFKLVSVKQGRAVLIYRGQIVEVSLKK